MIGLIVHETGHALGLQHNADGIMKAGAPPTDSYAVTSNEVGDTPSCQSELSTCGIRGVYGWDTDTTGGGIPVE